MIISAKLLWFFSSIKELVQFNDVILITSLKKKKHRIERCHLKINDQIFLDEDDFSRSVVIGNYRGLELKGSETPNHIIFVILTGEVGFLCFCL